MSVDTRTTGRKLDKYARHVVDDSVQILVDPDLARLPVEINLENRGLLGRRLRARVDGLDGAPCPINLIR